MDSQKLSTAYTGSVADAYGTEVGVYGSRGHLKRESTVSFYLRSFKRKTTACVWTIVLMAIPARAHHLSGIRRYKYNLLHVGNMRIMITDGCLRATAQHTAFQLFSLYLPCAPRHAPTLGSSLAV